MNAWEREHSYEYRRYLTSPEWRRFRSEALARARFRCQRCGLVYLELEVHHKSYDNFGAEEWSDVEVLCPGCHRAADRERRARRASHAWRARFEGWAVKVYGDSLCWPNDAEQRFEDWLEGES